VNPRSRDPREVDGAVAGDEDVIFDAHAAEAPEALQHLGHQELLLNWVLQRLVQQLSYDTML
jgi:hypothetical protein